MYESNSDFNRVIDRQTLDLHYILICFPFTKPFGQIIIEHDLVSSEIYDKFKLISLLCTFLRAKAMEFNEKNCHKLPIQINYPNSQRT